ncbi:PREDICTED: leucine-rich repeat-containing protein 34 isoform X4 [Myotis brandtii]|uniref:leucine-rich repeat-containing protein 34 isoform X4 n=1 Tax=Myotis brandtii TaxID=109478 RepID=UPI0003BB78E1|nr:PREDICTED: leucine-rich repeat-containing protein 34 isoform X4 [Myotis brandtii]
MRAVVMTTSQLQPAGERSMEPGSEKAPWPRTPYPAPPPTQIAIPTWGRAQAFAPRPVTSGAPEPIDSLWQLYIYLCMENSQRVNDFILQKLKGVDEEIEKGSRGITLNLAGNNHSMPVERLTNEDFLILSKTLEKNPYINGLDVRYNLISDAGLYYAAKLLQKQHSLIYLNLMFNDIGPKGGELIAKALHKNTTLKYLRMTGNKVENKGGMCFAAMLQMNSSLEKLDLGDTDLGMQSVIAFATVLTQNQTIKAINLNRPILYGEQEESTVHLGHMLKENHSLITLHMSKHNVKNSGLKQLCDALYLNRSLRYLDVSWLSIVSNNIEGEGLVALSQSMKTNPTLSNICIWGNKFDEATCVAYSNLIKMGRLKPDDTDVQPYEVDGRVYLSEVSNGLKRHYYWTPTYGEASSHSSNAGFSLVPVGQQL